MPEELVLDDVRLKDADELSEEEKKFLGEHQDELTDEERETFGIEVKGEEEKEEEGKEEKPVVFKTKEEFDTAVEERVKVMIEADKRAKLEEEERKKAEAEGRLPERVFPEGYMPTVKEGWEVPARKIIDRAKEEIRSETETREREVRGRLEEINKEFDEQIIDIRKNNPDLPATGTDEGEEFERELAEIGTKFKGVTDMNEAFEIWQAKQGVGGKPSEKQKSLAGKVGKTGGETTPEKRKYSEVAGRTLDEAEAAAVKKFKALK